MKTPWTTEVGLICSCLLVCATTVRAELVVHMLDAADWGISSLIPTAISADGSTVIGGGFNREALVHQGYVWPLEGELRFVGGLTGGTGWSTCHTVSDDGSVVGGYSFNAFSAEAFLWTEDDGLRGLGNWQTDDYGAFQVDAVTATGDVAYGSLGSITTRDAFRWTEETGRKVILPYADISSVTPDGQWVVGTWYESRIVPGGVINAEAFRMRPEGEPERLGFLGGFGTSGYSGSAGYDVSADGSVIVGYSWSKKQEHPVAFRWTAKDGMTELDGPSTFEYYSTTATAVSGDGSIIVGNGSKQWREIDGWKQGSFAAVWDKNGRFYELSELLSDHPVIQPDHALTSAVDISADGDTIVGTVEITNERGYRYGVFVVTGIREHLEALASKSDDLRWPSATRDESGWLVSKWFGWWWPAGDSDWIYHGEHGWVFPASGDEDSGMHVYDTHLASWLWYQKDGYPWTYAAAPIGMWLYYSKGGSPGGRWFYTEDGHWRQESELADSEAQ